MSLPRWGWGMKLRKASETCRRVAFDKEIVLPRRKRNAGADHSSVARVYEQLKRRAITFEFRPGDRLNEVAIARQFGVSRTPLREALNRLTMDGFLTFSPNQGFFRRPLEVNEIF